MSAIRLSPRGACPRRLSFHDAAEHVEDDMLNAAGDLFVNAVLPPPPSSAASDSACIRQAGPISKPSTCWRRREKDPKTPEQPARFEEIRRPTPTRPGPPPSARRRTALHRNWSRQPNERWRQQADGNDTDTDRYASGGLLRHFGLRHATHHLRVQRGPATPSVVASPSAPFSAGTCHW